MTHTSSLADKLDKWRKPALLVTILVAIGVFLVNMGRFYPVGSWLTWRYSLYWLVATLWASAQLALGLVLLKALRAPRWSWNERALHAFGAGLVAWFLLLFLLGITGLFNAASAVLLPFGALALGGKALISFASERRRVARKLRIFHKPDRSRWLHGLVLVFGVAALVFLYLGIVHPHNAAYDARWYHLGIAEEYYAQGKIARFEDGWYLGAFPHLASILYTWVYLLPGLRLFDVIALCAHLEMMVFLWTLLGISVLVRAMIRGTGSRLSWVSIFSFPGLFLYDSGLHLTSDHFAAFWAPSLFLCFTRIWRTQPQSQRLERSSLAPWLLLCLAATGALLTKYSVTCLLAFIAVGVALKVLIESSKVLRSREEGALGLQLGRIWTGPLALLLAGLILTAPHWLKNWIWYGNPVFPYAYQVFQGQPWEHYPTQAFTSWWSTHPWAPRGPLSERLIDTLKVFATFSFIPHDWINFHGRVPIFGSLFTLCTLFLPFIKAQGRIWALAIACYLGIAVWFSGMQFDRYLQVILPWMAAMVAAICIKIWREHGLWTRLSLGALIGLQVIWGLDVWSLPAHAIVHQPPIALVPELAVSGYHKRIEDRLHVFEPYRSIGLKLGPDARILLHNNHLRAGLKTSVLNDSPLTQTGIDYGSWKTPQEIHKRVTEMGATHVMARVFGGTEYSSYAWDLSFQLFFHRHTEQRETIGEFTLASIMDAPPLNRKDYTVSYFGCQGGYQWGNYSIEAMNFPHGIVTDPRRFPAALQLEDKKYSAQRLLWKAAYVVHSPSCRKDMPKGWQSRFVLVQQREGHDLYIRSSLLR